MFDFSSPLPVLDECYLDVVGVNTFHKITAPGVVGWKIECSGLEGAWKDEVGTERVAKQFGSPQGIKESGDENTRTMLGWDHGQVFGFLGFF